MCHNLVQERHLVRENISLSEYCEHSFFTGSRKIDLRLSLLNFDSILASIYSLFCSYSKFALSSPLFLPPICQVSEVYSESSQMSKMELFAKIINGFQSVTIFSKSPSQMVDWVLNKPLNFFTLWKLGDCLDLILNI